MHITIPVLASMLFGLMLGCGGSGHTNTVPSNAAPSNLVYPQTTITASVGQAITPDTPTVAGTVSSYSVSPALPAGLSLNTSTGTISGNSCRRFGADGLHDNGGKRERDHLGNAPDYGERCGTVEPGLSADNDHGQRRADDHARHPHRHRNGQFVQ